MNPALSVSEEELHAWLDGELPFERKAAVEAHLAAHPEERRRLDSYRADGEAIARMFSYVEATAPMPVSAAPQRRARWLPGVGPAIAAGLLMGAIGLAGGMLAQRETPKTEYAELLEEVTGYHLVYARETNHLVEIPATERQEIVDWMGERLGRKLSIPDLSGEGMTFAGGRLLVVNRRPVAQLLYTRPGRAPLGVCVTQLSEPPARMTLEDHDGLHLASWTDGRYGYIVIGDLPKEEVRQAADRVAATFGG